MQWPALLPLLLKERRDSPPQILVVHCVWGVDLGLLKGKALVTQARSDLVDIQARWPGVSIVFSGVMPHKVWCGHGDPRCLDRASRKLNREMRKVMVGSWSLFATSGHMGGIGSPVLSE